MKVRIKFFDPEAVKDSVGASVTAAVAEIPSLDDDEREILIEMRSAKAVEFCEAVIPEGSLTVEVDTETGSLLIVPSEAV